MKITNYSMPFNPIFSILITTERMVAFIKLFKY